MERDRQIILQTALEKRKPIIIEDTYRVTPEGIPPLVYPFVEYINQTEPDYILACDRGGRFIGLAVHALYQRIYGALPTHDRSIHFKKISQSVPFDEIKKSLAPDIKKLLKVTDSPHMFILDDSVHTGKTKDLAYNAISELSGDKIRITYGAIQGEGIDVVGSNDEPMHLEWLNNENLIGIDYPYESATPFAIRSPQAREYRNQLRKSIDTFAQSILK